MKRDGESQTLPCFVMSGAFKCRIKQDIKLVMCSLLGLCHILEFWLYGHDFSDHN